MMDPSSSLARFIRFAMRDVTYHKLYPSTVMAMAGTNAVELLPDDPTMQGSGLSNVPLRLGLPGAQVTVRPGARVLLGFEGGDPRKPYAAGWGPSSVAETILPNGSLPAARQGDLVMCGGPTTLFTLVPLTPATAGPVVTGTPYLLTTVALSNPTGTPNPFIPGTVFSGNPLTKA